MNQTDPLLARARAYGCAYYVFTRTRYRDERIALDVTTESVTPNVGIVLWRDDRFVIFFIATRARILQSTW